MLNSDIDRNDFSKNETDASDTLKTAILSAIGDFISSQPDPAKTSQPDSAKSVQPDPAKSSDVTENKDMESNLFASTLIEDIDEGVTDGIPSVQAYYNELPWWSRPFIWGLSKQLQGTFDLKEEEKKFFEVAFLAEVSFSFDFCLLTNITYHNSDIYIYIFLLKNIFSYIV